MSVKRTWQALTRTPRATMRPIYSGPNGNTLTGTQHLVWLPLEVSSGPDKGRIVAAEMDPETALVLAQQLIDAAGHAQRAKAAM